MEKKYITISLSQAKELRGALNTSASDLRDIVDRHNKGLHIIGWVYHKHKAEQLEKFARIIDKKIKKATEE